MNDEQLESERVAWNRWNAEHREASQGRISLEQADLIEGWLQRLFPRGGASLLEVGCGTGWMSERLAAYGRVTGVDLADEVIERAQARAPHVTFVAGNFLHANVGSAPFDAVVAMEAMAHFSDQEAFVRRVAALLRPGGSVLLATQNRPMMERNIRHLPNRGWHRRWVDQDELRALLEPYFLVNELRSITPTFFWDRCTCSTRVPRRPSPNASGWVDRCEQSNVSRRPEDWGGASSARPRSATEAAVTAGAWALGARAYRAGGTGVPSGSARSPGHGRGWSVHSPRVGVLAQGRGDGAAAEEPVDAARIEGPGVDVEGPGRRRDGERRRRPRCAPRRSRTTGREHRGRASPGGTTSGTPARVPVPRPAS